MKKVQYVIQHTLSDGRICEGVPVTNVKHPCAGCAARFTLACNAAPCAPWLNNFMQGRNYKESGFRMPTKTKKESK